MSERSKPVVTPEVSEEALRELIRRVEDVNRSYLAVAEKMGQLYMCADENNATALTSSLDKPMRNASENQQMFAVILEDLKMQDKRAQ